MKQLAILLFSLFFIAKTSAQCGVTVNAGPDIHYCQGDPDPELHGSFSGTPFWWHWTPATGLSNGKTLNPMVLGLNGNRKYKLQASGWSAQNLVFNGDFEQGNTGFVTELTNSTNLAVANRYAVTDQLVPLNPASLSNCADHTTGSGKMFVANMSGPGKKVMQFDLPAKVGSQYRLRFWVMNPSWQTNSSSVQVHFNGGPMSPWIISPAAGGICEWVMYEYTIFSNWNVMAFQVFANAAGYIAIDDVEIVEQCEVEDEVSVIYHPKPPLTTVSATICEGDSYTVGNETFDSEGNYYIPVQTWYGCDSIVQLQLHTVRIKPTILPSDPAFSCYIPNVLLTAGNTGAFPPGTKFHWTTSGGGTIQGNPNSTGVFAATPGTYFLKTTYDLNGLHCADSTDTQVTVPVDVPVAKAGAPKAIGCVSPTVALAGSYLGGQNFQVNWTTPNGQILSGQNTVTPTVGAGGTYILTVTNLANGCSDVDTTTVAVNMDVPLANAGQPATLNCLATTVSLSGQAATGPNFEFTWTTPDGHFTGGLNTLSPTVDKPGQYFLSVLNKNNGCIGTSSVTIPQDITKPDAQIGQPFTINCYAPNPAINASSSSGFAPQWTTVGGHFTGGTNTFQPTVDEAGLYFLKVVNPVNFCETNLSVQVSKNISFPSASIAPPPQLDCASQTGTLIGGYSNAGNSPAFNWTTADGHVASGQNSPTPTVDATGNYLFTVTNPDNGCSASAQVTVTGSLVLPVFSIAPPARLNCYNQTVALSATPGNFSYQWTTSGGQILGGGNTPNATAGAPGTYQLVVTSNFNSCTAAKTVLVEKTQPPTVSVSSTQNAACFGQNSGSATASAANGWGTYSFVWSSGQFGPTASNLPSGPVSVTVTDADFCTATATTFVAQPPQLLAGATSTPQTNVNSIDGTATASGNGGTPGYTFLWSNGMTSPTITGLFPGPYTVTVTDANGCKAVATVTVSEAPCQISLTGTATDELCHDSHDGSITALAVNDAAPTFFVWSTGEFGPKISNLPAGSYTVTATDANGCTTSKTFTISQPDELVLAETHQDVQCPADLTGSATVAASGGTGGVSYLWQNGPSGPTWSGIGAGNYSVVAADANGCTASISVEIKAVDNLAPVLKVKNRKFPIDVNGKAQIVAADFDDGSSDNCGITKWTAVPSSFDCSQLGLHDITLTATDGAGNATTTTAQAEIVDETAPILTCPSNKQAWWCSPTVAFPYPVAIDNCLDNGGQFELLGGLQSGSVFPVGKTINTWKFTDGSGNSSTCAFSVTVHEQFDLSVSEILPTCHGDCDGVLSAITSGGAGPFDFIWEMGQPTQTITGVCAGPHVVAATDGGGCEVQVSVSLDEPAALSLSNPLFVNDTGAAGIGAFPVSVAGGTARYFYEWPKNGQFFSTDQNLTGLKTGEYELKIIDSNGCVLTSTGEPGWAAGMGLFPNPSDGRAELLFHEKLGGEVRVDAFDATGRLIETFGLMARKLAVNSILGEQAAGVYCCASSSATGWRCGGWSGSKLGLEHGLFDESVFQKSIRKVISSTAQP